MIKSVVRQYRWAPEIIGAFFVDEIDYNGLEYWYDDVIEMHRKK